MYEASSFSKLASFPEHGHAYHHQLCDHTHVATSTESPKALDPGKMSGKGRTNMLMDNGPAQTEPGPSKPHVEIWPVEGTQGRTLTCAPPNRRARQDALETPKTPPIQRRAGNAVDVAVRFAWTGLRQ